MKKIALYMLGTMVAFSACTDEVLNGDPYTEFTKDTYFTSETNVEMFANYFYTEFSGYGNSGTYGNFYFNFLNDDQGTTGVQTWTYTAVPATISLWSNAYTEIRRANTLIEALPNIDDMTSASKANWEGIARLYRAWQHYKLVRAFGDCYWVDKTLDSSDEDILYGARDDRSVVMGKVLEDLNYAVANISANGSSRTAINNAVAQAMKAEVCLYEGGYSKYTLNDTSRANTYYTEAKNACQAIMSNSNYELNADYQANFNSLDLSGNKEMILYKKYIYGTLAHSVIDYTCGSTQVHGMSKDAFDSYLFIDGKPKATTSRNTSDVGKIVNIDDNTGLGAADRIDISDVLAERDPRLSAQVDPILQYPGNGYARYNAKSQSTSSTGYGVYLFDTDQITATNRQSISGGDTDAPIFWLAQIYLNYAEACVELGSISQAELDATINKLRARVGMPAMSLDPDADPANNMGVSNLIWEVRRERRVELMYCQDDRYQSLVRWNQLQLLDTTKYPDQVRGAHVGAFANNAGCTADVDSEGYINCSSGNTRVWDSKYALYPIPSGQLSLNPQMGQNPGW